MINSQKTSPHESGLYVGGEPLRFTGDPAFNYARAVILEVESLVNAARRKSLPLGHIIGKLAYEVDTKVRKEFADKKIICSEAGGYDGQDCGAAVCEGYNRLIKDIHAKLEGTTQEKQGREFLREYVESINNGG